MSDEQLPEGVDRGDVNAPFPDPNEFDWETDEERHLAEQSLHVRGLRKIIESPFESGDSFDEDDPLFTPEGKKQWMRDWVLTKGILWEASVTIVDSLFDDVITLAQDEELEDPDAWKETFVISALPKRFGHKYGALFAKMFTIAMADVTSAIANKWNSPASTAHELAANLLLTQADMIRESNEIDLKFDHIESLSEIFFEDRDFDLLYDQSLDGIEEDTDPQFSFVNLTFDDWFKPFPYAENQTPYATITPGEPGPSR